MFFSEFQMMSLRMGPQKGDIGSKAVGDFQMVTLDQLLCHFTTPASRVMGQELLWVPYRSEEPVLGVQALIHSKMGME